jgi:hypothetical protein
VRSFFDHEVDAEILHRRIKKFLDGAGQPVDLIDEQDVPRLQVGEDTHEIPTALQRWAGGGDDVRVHLMRNHVRQRGLP